MKKAVKGQDLRFNWDPPRPYSGTPTLKVGFSSAFSGSFTQSRSDVTVSAIANDRRTLTLTGDAGATLER